MLWGLILNRTVKNNALFAAVWVAAAVLLFTAWYGAKPQMHAGSKIIRCELASAGMAVDDDIPAYVAKTLYQAQEQVAHSPTIAQHKDGSIQVIWFAGEDEADPDTGLVEMRLTDGVWSKPKQVLTARTESETRNLSIYTIGNPVLHANPDGKAYLFYVTLSLGGWATSRISMRTSADYGQNWSEARLLANVAVFQHVDAGAASSNLSGGRGDCASRSF